MRDSSPHSATTRPEGRHRFWLIVCLIGACHHFPPPAPTPRGLATRVNQVGSLPDAPKVAVVCALGPRVITSFDVVDERNRRVFGPRAAGAAGPFGPCAATSRLDFSTLRQTGVYRIEAAGVTSLPVRIGDDVYQGAADSLLAYLREQRSGYNPVFRDSVHHRSDGVLVDHPTRSGEFIPVSGGRRPVYPCTGKPQGLFEFKNRSTGLASTAGKYAAAFALGAAAFHERDSAFAQRLGARARAVYALGVAHPGVCQTAPARAPYFYEEDDWADDVELGAVELYALTSEPPYRGAALQASALEP